MKLPYYSQEPNTLAEVFETDLDQGLNLREARLRLEQHGANKLHEAQKDSAWTIFMRQFNDFITIVLMVTTAISALLGEVVDSVAILAIIVLNAGLGFIQEYRAEKSLDALKQLTAPIAKVIRGGRQVQVDAEELVPGDIIILEAGDRVPADARLFRAAALYANEAMLTGESLPVAKKAEAVQAENVPVGDQRNMVFMGTLITRGRGAGLVVATGMDTEIGKIAGLIQESVVTETPLQHRLKRLGAWLVIACLIVVTGVFIAGVLRGFPIYRMFFTGVSLAVAAIPEGLPAVVTIALAIGVQRMIRCNAIIRQLPAVETLGCATVICADKTGTLTQNRMKVQWYWIDGKDLDVRDSSRLRQLVAAEPHLELALEIGALCGSVQVHAEGSNVGLSGDPTEIALVEAAYSAGLDKARLEAEYPVLRELPFDSERKRMSVVLRHDDQLLVYAKGAPGVILERSTRILTSRGPKPLSNSVKSQILAAVEEYAAQALRILGLAYRQVPSVTVTEDTLENGLIFVGFVGMMDPPRMEVKRAIRQAKQGGIRTIMVTGDHKLTAQAIADQLELSWEGRARVMTGGEWEMLSSFEKQDAVRKVDVFARVAPHHKLSIVRALQQNGEVVGMTGDGVNDAPAVKEADIGISMGISGTDVTKEASDMILADDNYQTIIAAIREGRAIYDNIRKFIRYLLGCNVGEVLTMFVATLAGLPLPLIPIQILWMNLVTDGLPAIALGVDPSEEDIMERKPRNARESIFARRLHLKIGFSGVLISICTLAVFVLALKHNPEDIVKARTLAFTTLVMAQLIFVFECRSEYHSIFEIGIFSNTYLVAAVTISSLMHVLVVYHPWLQNVFGTTALNVDEWLLVLGFAGATLVIDTAISIAKRQIKRHFSWLRLRK
jgi:Ca2+-transporting ATPase